MPISRSWKLQLSIIALAAAGGQTYMSALGLTHFCQTLPLHKQIIIGITIMCGLCDILALMVRLILKLVSPNFNNEQGNDFREPNEREVIDFIKVELLYVHKQIENCTINDYFCGYWRRYSIYK